jgi:hypothetical protein
VLLPPPSPPGALSRLLRDGWTAVRRRNLPGWLRGAAWWREIILVGALYGAYELSRGLGDINVNSALAHGRTILHWERLWHLAPERVLNTAVDHVTWIAVAASYFYSVMHYVVTPAVLVWMYRKHREQYGPARTALAFSTILGLFGYLLLPTAPPRMLAHSGLHDTLAATSGYGWWGGEGSVPRGLGALTNQFAAMPSLHVGWAIWCGVLIAMYAQRWWVRTLGVLYPITTTLVVMATGNHYLLDALAGAVTMAAGAGLMLLLRSRTKGTLAPRDTLQDVVAGRSRAAVRAAVAATQTRPHHSITREAIRHEAIAADDDGADLCPSQL